MKTRRDLHRILEQNFQVISEDELLTVNETLIDCSSFPNCTILGGDTMQANALVLYLHNQLLQEHAAQAKFELFQLDKRYTFAKGQLSVPLADHVKRAWRLQDEPIEVSCKVDLATYSLSELVYTQSKPSAVLRILKEMPVNNLLELRAIESEIPGLNRFCCICGKPHAVHQETLMLRACRDPLCTFVMFYQPGNPHIGEKALALLSKFFHAAIHSTRQELICNPFPTIFKDAETYILHPTEKRDLDLAKSMAAELIKGCPNPLLDWLNSSCASYLIEKVLHPFGDHEFFGVFSASPLEEDLFAKMKAEHGSIYAFHGSRLENWHSILHNGLRNASGTKLQLNGAAYGPGVYLSPNSSVSYGYSANTSGEYCIAIAEVINLEIKQHGDIWVQPDDSRVQLRFLMFCKSPLQTYDLRKLKPELDALNDYSM